MSEVSPNQEITAIKPQTDEANKAKYKRLLKRGQQFLCGGIVLMGASMLINFQMHFSGAGGSMTVLMYTVTSLGAACLIKGIVDIMG